MKRVTAHNTSARRRRRRLLLRLAGNECPILIWFSCACFPSEPRIKKEMHGVKTRHSGKSPGTRLDFDFQDGLPHLKKMVFFFFFRLNLSKSTNSM